MVWADPVTQMVGVMCPAASEATHNVDYNLISTKTPDQIAMMREAGKICAQILQELTPHVKPGVTVGRGQKLSHYRGQIEPASSLPRGATEGCFGEVMAEEC